MQCRLMKYALAFSLLMTPALAQEVDFSNPELIASGKAVFADFCMACHGQEGSGGNGPDIQGSILSDVTLAIRGTDQMESVDLSEGEPESVTAYLMSLAPKVAETKLRLEAARRQRSE